VAEVDVGSEAGPADSHPTRGYLRSAIVTFVIVAVMTIAYLSLPLNDVGVSNHGLVAFTFICGVAGMGALVYWQALGFRQRLATGSVRLRGLLVAVYTAMLFFAGVYYSLEVRDPGQISGLHTRLDSIYFTVTTLSTVGYGDIHAAGQAARAIVLLQMIFDLLVIGLAVAAARAAVAEHRADAARRPPAD
jgi:hypothetical protein